MTTQTASSGTRRNPLLSFFYYPDWRIRNKLLFGFFVLLVIIAAGIVFIGIPQVQNALLEVGTTSLVTSTNATSSAIDQYLADKLEDIVSASGSNDFIGFLQLPELPNTKSSALRGLKAAAARIDYESVALVGMDGKVLLSSSEADIGTDLAFRLYFTEARAGRTYISDPSVSVVTNRPAIFFSSPVRDTAGTIIGVIRSRLSLNGIWALVERNKDAAGPGTYGMLLDENGVRIANSLSLGRRDEMEGSLLLYTAIAPIPANIEKTLVDEKRYGKAAGSNIQVVAMPDVANALVTPGTKTFETASDVNPERHQAAIAALSAKPWRYVLMTPISVFTATADRVRNGFSLGLLIIGILTIIYGYFTARSITDPIAKLTRAADAISLGELDTKIEIASKDEVGELAEAVSRMQSSLQAAIERLRARRTSH